ncbi:MAG: efflux RND transporter permease subunit [Opitutales bacterium]
MIQWFARNGVAANLLAAIIVLGGITSLLGIKMELFPEFSLDRVSVTVPYRGAAPEEVERAVIWRIEEEIEDLEGIKQMTSRAVEGSGNVTVEVERGYNLIELKEKIKSRVDTIDTFPVETEEPIIEELEVEPEVIVVAVHGETDQRTLKALGEKVRADLLAIPGITKIELLGLPSFEITIEVSEEDLRRYGLTFSDVADAIQETSVDLPGGAVKASSGEILLRTVGQAYTGEEFEQIVLLTQDDGTRILLGDVARVIDGFEDDPILTRFQGEPAVMLQIFEVGDQNPLDIVEKVEAYVAELNWLPEGIQVTPYRDFSYYLWGRLNTLITNGSAGLLLVLLVLTLFLRPSLAFWVTLGIPISFLGALLVMGWVGVSINLISLFAFIVVLGIVVDDAIVVGESVFSRFQETGGSSVQASIEGAEAVAKPVTFAVITTMVAFVPILMLPGTQGKFLYAIPVVVIITLFFSLVESKLILPYHLSLTRVGTGDRSKVSTFGRMQRGVADGLERFIRKYYKPQLEFILRHRYYLFAGFTAILLVTVGLMLGGWIKFVPFPRIPSDYIETYIALPEGASVEDTRRVLDRVEAALDETIAQVEAEGFANPLRYRRTIIGQQQRGGGPGGTQGNGGSHLAQIDVELVKSEGREVSAPALADRWRENVGTVPGLKEITFEASAGGGQGEPINVELRSNDLTQLRGAANFVKNALTDYPGVYDIRDSLADNQQELKIDILPAAETLGLSQAQLGRQVRQAFFGEEAQRVQRGRDDVRVMVRFPEQDRATLDSLESMRIRTRQGEEVPFSEVAEIQLGTGYAAISRIDRQRATNVFADADKEEIDLEAVKRDLADEILPAVQQQFPGLRASLEGESKDQRESLDSLQQSFLLVLAIMYALLAVAFRSYIQPIIVMLIIPFGIIGAAGGHLIMGYPLSFFSIYGILALSGVVVNDSLVLVDYINRQREKGVPLHLAVRDAGVRRFRPILLTSLTTFVGLTPLLFERSLQAQFLIPMAISLSFGVAFATFLTLGLVPATYLILEDIQRICGATWNWLLGRDAKPLRLAPLGLGHQTAFGAATEPDAADTSDEADATDETQTPEADPVPTPEAPSKQPRPEREHAPALRAAPKAEGTA